MCTRLTILVLLLPLALLAGCKSIRERAQDGLTEALPQLIGPAEEYHVTIDGPSGELRHGRLARVRITGKRVRAPGMPEFAEMELEAQDLVIDMSERCVKSCKSATVTASLSEAEMTKMLNARVRTWQRKRVKSLEGTVRIEGWLNAGPVHLRGSGDYALSVKRGVEIWATPTKISFQGEQAHLPALLRNRAAAVLNPIYTLTDERLKLRMTSVTPKVGAVWVTGTVDPVGMKLGEEK